MLGPQLPYGPGYCTTECSVSTDCALPSGTVGTAVCASGSCEIDCAAAGAACPSGMNCRDVDDGPISEVFRCRYID